MRYLPLLLLVACSGTDVNYDDPGQVETMDVQFGSTDLLQIAQEMTQSFTNSHDWGTERPRVVFGGVKNATTQHIDTVNITDTISTSLVQSGKFSVLAGEQGMGEIMKELGFQDSDRVNPATAAAYGKQLGAEFVLYGRFTEIRKEVDDKTNSWLKFTMSAVKVETRELVWADEKQISKTAEKTGLFGW